MAEDRKIIVDCGTRTLELDENSSIVLPNLEGAKLYRDQVNLYYVLEGRIPDDVDFQSDYRRIKDYLDAKGIDDSALVVGVYDDTFYRNLVITSLDNYTNFEVRN